MNFIQTIFLQTCTWFALAFLSSFFWKWVCNEVFIEKRCALYHYIFALGYPIAPFLFLETICKYLLIVSNEFSPMCNSSGSKRYMIVAICKAKQVLQNNLPYLAGEYSYHEDISQVNWPSNLRAVWNTWHLPHRLVW